MKKPDHKSLNLVALSDRRLMEATSRCRSEASGGAPESARIAREHEDELTRRFGGATTMAATLDDDPGLPKRPWWRF